MTDLPDDLLALNAGDVVWIDDDAAGAGWFVDPTPSDDAEFRARGRGRELRATGHSPAAGRVDLLTVLLHELGHVLGLDHGETAGLMAPTLSEGTRRLPGMGEPAHEGIEALIPSLRRRGASRGWQT